MQRVRSVAGMNKGSNVELRRVLLREEREFEKAMDDDLNTPRALAALHRIARAVNRALDQGRVSGRDAAAIHRTITKLDKVFGIFGEQVKAESLSQEAELLIRQRDEARAKKDWATADKLREELSAMGIVVEDTPTGTVWKRKPQ